MRERPPPGEIPPFYRGYVELVPDGDVVVTLERQIRDTLGLLASISVGREGYRYRDSAWSTREVVGHMIDTERLFAYRALSIARGDPAPLPGMDQDAWARNSSADARPLRELADEFRTVRASTVHFFRSLDPAAWSRNGTASDHPFVVRIFPWIIAGHELHHRAVLKDRYQNPIPPPGDAPP